jgi:hypothetical protein
MRIKKLSCKILAWYLIFGLSYTTMNFEFWRPPLKSAILENSKCSGIFDVIVSTHAGRATQKSIRDYSKTRSCLHRVVLYKIAAILLTRTQVDHCIRAQMTNLWEEYRLDLCKLSTPIFIQTRGKFDSWFVILFGSFFNGLFWAFISFEWFATTTKTRFCAYYLEESACATNNKRQA